MVATWHPGFLDPFFKLLLNSNVLYKKNCYVDVQEKGAQNGQNCDEKRETRKLFHLSELQVFEKLRNGTVQFISETSSQFFNQLVTCRQIRGVAYRRVTSTVHQ